MSNIENQATMKESKTGSRSAKSIENKTSVKHRKVKTEKSFPSEEDIREKAEELYHQRIERGEDGSALEDWIQAESILQETIVQKFDKISHLVKQ